jgi:hypothetical protein
MRPGWPKNHTWSHKPQHTTENFLLDSSDDEHNVLGEEAVSSRRPILSSFTKIY